MKFGLVEEPRPPPEEVVDRLVHRSDDQDMFFFLNGLGVGVLGCCGGLLLLMVQKSGKITS